MDVSRQDFDAAAREAALPAPQAARLWQELETRAAARPHFSGVYIAYYAGALIILGAMGWYMTRSWERLGGGGIAALAGVYGLLFLATGLSMWRKPPLRVPAGLLCTVAVGMVPLVVYGIERLTGFWPKGAPPAYETLRPLVNGNRLAMELATIAAALLALRRIRFPFLTAPLAVALWCLSMDLSDYLLGRRGPWYEHCWISVSVGAAMLVAGMVVDRKTEEDYAFWLYLFGLMAFWGGLTSLPSTHEWGKALYGLINLGLMVLAVLLERRAFLLFGAAGVSGYLVHLAREVFRDSLAFSFVLSLIGIAVIYTALKYQQNQARVNAWVQRRVPRHMRRMFPSTRPAI